MAKSMQQKLAEFEARMFILEEENEHLKKGASLKPAKVEVACKLSKQAKKSKGGKFVYVHDDEARGIKVYVYTKQPMVAGSSVSGKVV